MKPIATAAALAALLLAAACSSGPQSIEDLAAAAGCANDFDDPKTTDEGVSSGCIVGTDTFYFDVFNDSSDLQDRLTYLRGMPKDGTAGKWVVYGDDWSIICFKEDLCEELEQETGGTLEELKPERR